MYKEHFGLHEDPFDLNTDPRFLYLSPAHARARAYLDYAVYKGDSLVVITGEIGVGKSTLIHEITDRIHEDSEVVVLRHPHANAVEFLQAVAHEWGGKAPAATKTELLAQIRAELAARFAWGTRTTLIVDEAQTLTRDVLEELRMLADQEINSEKPLGIVLVGQPCLRATLAARDLEQLRQRIRLSFHLAALDEDDTRGYIDRRLRVAGAGPRPIFDDATIPRIQKYTGGIPRLINVLADLSLTAAWMDGADTVTLEQVNSAIQELGWLPYSQRMRRIPLAPIARRWGAWVQAGRTRLARNGRQYAEKIGRRGRHVGANVAAAARQLKAKTMTPVLHRLAAAAPPNVQAGAVGSSKGPRTNPREMRGLSRHALLNGLQWLRRQFSDPAWLSASAVRGASLGFAGAMVASFIVFDAPPSITAPASPEVSAFSALSRNAAAAEPEDAGRAVAPGARNYLRMLEVVPALEPHSRALTSFEFAGVWQANSRGAVVVGTNKEIELPQPETSFEPVQPVEPLLPGLQPASWLLAQPADSYVIQILAARKREVLDRFLLGPVSDLDIAYYRKRRDDEDWYVLVSGVYPTRQSAMLASRKLPEKVLKTKPWVRSVAKVHDDIRGAQRQMGRNALL